ncbi:MAG: hypothetical protein UT31_C0019G0008 [Parcubacteria group bacterium GW2011_GWF2_39_13b]|nr:MAG: hypothetical protein UT31_C0019G0008 [Parcubacteria group bacterium GW2011_GWF2_39_13b]
MDFPLWLSRCGVILVLLFLMFSVRWKNQRQLKKEGIRKWEKYWIYDYACVFLYFLGSVFIAWAIAEAGVEAKIFIPGLLVIIIAAIIQDQIIKRIAV